MNPFKTKSRAELIEEKAQELVHNIMFKDTSFNRVDRWVAHKIALICVDEILNALNSDRIDYSSLYRCEEHNYWESVKLEIEKL